MSYLSTVFNLPILKISACHTLGYFLLNWNTKVLQSFMSTVKMHQRKMRPIYDLEDFFHFFSLFSLFYFFLELTKYRTENRFMEMTVLRIRTRISGTKFRVFRFFIRLRFQETFRSMIKKVFDLSLVCGGVKDSWPKVQTRLA